MNKLIGINCDLCYQRPVTVTDCGKPPSAERVRFLITFLVVQLPVGARQRLFSRREVCPEDVPSQDDNWIKLWALEVIASVFKFQTLCLCG